MFNIQVYYEKHSNKKLLSKYKQLSMLCVQNQLGYDYLWELYLDLVYLQSFNATAKP